MKIEIKVSFNKEEERELAAATYDTITGINLMGNLYGFPYIESSYLEDETSIDFTASTSVTQAELFAIKDKLNSASSLYELMDMK